MIPGGKSNWEEKYLKICFLLEGRVEKFILESK